MIQFGVTVRDLALKARFARALMKFSDFTPEMAKTGDYLLEDAKRRLAARNSPVSIGRLAKSLRRKAYKMAVTVASVLAYARVQQEGGTIYPKRGKMLAIPLRVEDARIHLWPRMVAGKPGVSLFVVKLGPKVILMYRKEHTKGKKAGTVEQYPRWLLVPKVTLKGDKPYLVKSPQLIQYMRTLIANKVRGANAA
jgi:hypothetical protein